MDLDFSKEDKKQPLIPEDKYQAVLCEVRDLGLVQGKFDTEPVPKVEFLFETEPIKVTDEEGKEIEKRFILKTFPQKKSKDDRSGYYKIFAALMGGKIDPNVKSSEDLIGNNVDLEITNGLKDGVPTFNNIKAVYKVKSSKIRELKIESYKPRENNTDFNYGANSEAASEEI